MGQELGRISGVMLKENLERQGIDLSVDDDLLYLDVNNASIGINTTATSTQVALNINSTFKTDNLITNALKLPSLTINTPSANTISSTTGNLYLNALGSITAPNIRTDDLNFNDNVISSTSSNQSIELRPAGAVEITTNLNVAGNLFATGDILIEGTIVFGDTVDAVTETVQIKAEVNSDIIPTQTEVFSLGSDPDTGGAQWLNTYIRLLNGQDITVNSVQANGVDLTQRQGKTWYVSKNGNDTNYGDHEASTFLTIKHTLENPSIQSGDTIIIYPGTYEEITPLVVPQGVAIRGLSLRSVKITADPTTIDHNVFELNGETTVTNVTVANFRYNATNDTGYAFSFADNFTVTSRSPYVQDVSVITSGSVTTLSDPRGFAAGDAGKGALVDGAKALSTSKEASMLFHSVTFITPGVDGLTMRNGVRVEWLNSFVYFANIAMYATAGTGRYDALRNTTRYGAEVRSIGSACVYGNYGAWAEGPGTLMYLINHNFSYIGAGKDSTNDPSVHNAENEITMLDTGDIHYQSFDNDGNFHIGDPFTVSFNDGTASINGVGLTVAGVSSILFGSTASDTVVTSGLVSTGNIKFSGNKISSLGGDVDLVSGTDLINLSLNVSAKKNIAIDNNFALNGTLTIGNAVIDIAEFNAPTNSDILPSADRLYRLGSPGQQWNKIINQLTVIDGNIQLFDNVIQTSQSNSNLELRTQGVGKILLENNALTVANQLTINGDTTTKSISVAGNIDQIGSIIQTGDRDISNGVDLTGNILATVEAQFETVTISQGLITTTESNADLELRAAGTGQIVFPAASVLLQNNLTVNDTMTANNAVITNNIVSSQFDIPSISFYTNIIVTRGTDQDLVLGAHSNGLVISETSDVLITQNLQVDGSSTIGNAVIVGDMDHTGLYALTGDIAQSGNYSLSNNLTVSLGAQFANVEIENNVITTTDSNSDLELRASGTGLVKVDDNFRIENNLNVNGITATDSLINSGTITSDKFSDGNILISQNYITTTTGDLTLISNNDGLVSAAFDNVLIDNNLQVEGTSTLSNTVVGSITNPATLTLTGTINRTGAVTETGNFNLSNNLTVTGTAQLANIDIVNNVITTSDSNSDLELRAAPGNRIYAGYGNVAITNDLRVNETTTTSTINNSNTVFSDTFKTTDLIISQNYITSQPNANIKLVAAELGNVVLPKITLEDNYIKATALNNNIELTVSAGSVVISATNALKIPVGTTANKSANTIGDIRLDTSDTLFTGWNGARVTFGGLFSTDRRTTVLAHPTNNSINFVTNTNATMSLTASGLAVNTLLVNSDLQITGTTISSTVLGSNITLTPNNAGYLELGNIRINSNNIQNNNTGSNIILGNTGNGYVKFGGTGGIAIPAGNEASRPTLPETGDFRFNTTLSAAEVFNGVDYVSLSGTSNALLTAEEIAEITNLYSLVLG